MANRIQFRRDSAQRWASINPVLMEGEIGFETDTNHFKLGNGTDAWNSLEYGLGIENITSELGSSENLAASQKLVTEELEKQQDDIGANASNISVLSERAIRLTERVTHIANEGLYPQDIKKAENIRNSLKDIYLLEPLAENERAIISYYSLDSGQIYIYITKYNTEDGTNSLIVNNFALKDKEVTPIYSSRSSDATLVGYGYVDYGDYIDGAASEGETYERMTYLTSAAFDLNQCPIISTYLMKEQLATETEALNTKVTNKADKTAYLTQMTNFPQDKALLDNAKSLIGEIYLKDEIAEDERIIVNYLSIVSGKVYIILSKYNTTDKTTTVIAKQQAINDKAITPLYDDATTKGTLIGYVYLDYANYIGEVASRGESSDRFPYLTSAAFDLNQCPILRDFINKEEIMNLIDTHTTTQKITIWGDSITWGSASTTDSLCYAMVLQSHIKEASIDAEVINCGVGGETFQNILVRQGAFGFYLANDVTIPASSAEKVSVEEVKNYILQKRNFKNSYYGADSYFGLLIQGERGRGNKDYPTVNPIIVNGVECTMTYDGTLSDATIWLRVNADRANELEVKAGTLLYPAGNRIKSDITIFSIGTNDGWTIKTDNVFDAVKSAENYITMIDMAISKSNTEAFIVCSPYGGVALNVAGVEGLKVLEKALLKKYGSRYFNWREYLVNYGLSDAGITPTDEDTTAIEKGECPPSLLADGLHPNDYGHKVIGDKLYEIMNNIGYFN